METTLLIAKRQWTEQRRQPGFLAAIVGLYALLLVVNLVGQFMSSRLATNPEQIRWMAELTSMAIDPPVLAAQMSDLFRFLVFTQFLGFVAVIAGQSVLGDRSNGSWPFLMLAPIHPLQLILGKLVGSLALPLIGLWVFGAAGGILADWMGPNPILGTSTLGFLVFAPTFGAGVGLSCIGISILSRDVRTAQQLVWVLVFFASLVGGGLFVSFLHSSSGLLSAVVMISVCTTLLAALDVQLLDNDQRR